MTKNFTSPLVLGIETSCDETAAAVVDRDGQILAQTLYSQFQEHEVYGGVVPEVAARAHILKLAPMVWNCLGEAGVGFKDLAAIAATAGPGLIGGVFVGVMLAKAVALARGLPFLAINHLEGHALSPRLMMELGDERRPEFPYLLLLVSGGHCQLLVVEGVGRYVQLGTTLDDAAGEAFDKVAKLLGLGYAANSSGGANLERAAVGGNPKAYAFPRPLMQSKKPKRPETCKDNMNSEGNGTPQPLNFSFSGLKTAVRDVVMKVEGENGSLSHTQKADIAASFQAAVADCLVDRVQQGLRWYLETYPPLNPCIVVAGGVAANTVLRGRLQAVAAELDVRFVAPPMSLCTDNAAMIAWAGQERLALGQRDDLNFRPRPRWPLV